MPVIHKEGKDTIIFASKEDHATPSTIVLPEPEPSPGLLLANGDINWNCPCLGGMATGPCGLEFREAFSCFHYSTADPKGSDCFEAFKTMQMCMTQYPALYGNKDTSLEEFDDEILDEKEGMSTSDDREVTSTQESLELKREDEHSTKQDLERTNVN